VPVEAIGALAALDGDQILSVRSSTLNLLKATAAGVSTDWAATLPDRLEAVAVGLFGSAPWLLDSHAMLHVFDGATHHEQRRLRISEGARAAPAMVNGHLVIVDPLAGLKCYLLSGPQAADAGKP
jgi:hypothetical protein